MTWSPDGPVRSFEPTRSAPGHPVVAGSIIIFMSEPAVDTREVEPTLSGPRQRWDLFESLCGARIRAGDAAWAAGLSPTARLALVDDLLTTIRAARVAAGDWQALDDRAWRATLAERRLQVRAFRSLDEGMHGTGDLADAG